MKAFLAVYVALLPIGSWADQADQLLPLSVQQEEELRSFGLEAGVSEKALIDRYIRCSALKRKDIVECVKTIATPLWSTTISSDPFTDAPVAAAMQQLPSGDTILLGCMNGDAMIVLTTSSTVQSEKTSVLVRLDSGTPVTSDWDQQGDAFGVRLDGPAAEKLAEAISAASRLAIRVEVTSGYDTEVIDVQTFREEANDIFKACGWSLD